MGVGLAKAGPGSKCHGYHSHTMAGMHPGRGDKSGRPPECQPCVECDGQDVLKMTQTWVAALRKCKLQAGLLQPGETPELELTGRCTKHSGRQPSGWPGKGFVREGAGVGEGVGENPRDQETGISKDLFWKAQSRDSVT